MTDGKRQDKQNGGNPRDSGGSRGGNSSGRGGRGGRGRGSSGGRGRGASRGPARSRSASPVQRGKPRSQNRPPAPPPSPAPSSRRSSRIDTLSLSAWDLVRTRNRHPDSMRGQVMTLRTFEKLVGAFEDERSIPAVDRSYLRVREDARGSCLLVHGISTGPGDLHGLAGYLFDNGFNVYVVRLPDYGTPGHTISEVSWESALQQASQGYRLLNRGGGKVHVVGLGFGAALALHLASRESVAGLVLLSPAIMPRESFFQRLLVRLKLHRLRMVHGILGWNAELMEGMDLARGRIGRIGAPIYAAQCDDDDRASPDSLRFLQRKARHRGSRFQVFPSGGHSILAVHGDRVLHDEILKFCANG